MHIVDQRQSQIWKNICYKYACRRISVVQLNTGPMFNPKACGMSRETTFFFLLTFWNFVADLQLKTSKGIDLTFE